jgi:hypothetical protein
MRTYQFRSLGGRFSQGDAQIIGPELMRLRVGASSDAAPTERQRLIEAARDPSSSLHRFFTWDDGVAAKRYRDMEAQVMLRHILITVEDPTEREEPRLMRFASYVRADEPCAPGRDWAGKRRIADPQSMLDSPAYLAQEAARAEKQLAAWTAIYSKFRGLAEFRRFERFFTEIEALREEAEFREDPLAACQEEAWEPALSR